MYVSTSGSAWRHLPLPLHARYTLNPINQTQNLLLKASYVTNSLPGYPSLFFILRERVLEASSAWVSTLHTSLLKMTPLMYSAIHFSELKSQKASSINNILNLTTTQNTNLVIKLHDHIYELHSLMVMTTDQLQWRHKNVFLRCLHKGKKKWNLLPTSTPNGTSSFENRNLMFSCSSMWSTPSSGNERIFDKLYWQRVIDARMNPDMFGQ